VRILYTHEILFNKKIPLKKYCLEDKAACEIHGIKWMYDLFLDEEHGMKFFHMKNVSNWSSDKEEYHSNKLKSFTAAINAILDSGE
jgi:hypothetical protein